MKTDYKELIKKFFGHIKNTKVLAVIFIVGIGLMLLPGGKSDKKQTSAEEPQVHTTYKENIEQDLEKILSEIKGAGKVSVMVTLSDDGDTYFASDEKTANTKSDSEETKSREVSHVFKNKTSEGEFPLITKQTYPQISGVLICAEGAQNPQVKNNIVTAARALLGIKSHRIEVLERK